MSERVGFSHLDDILHLFGAKMLYSRLVPSDKGKTCADCALLVVETQSKSADSDLPPDSAKTRKIMEILREIDDRSKGVEKTIIFSQFTSMLDLIEPFLRAEKIRFVRCTSFLISSAGV